MSTRVYDFYLQGNVDNFPKNCDKLIISWCQKCLVGLIADIGIETQRFSHKSPTRLKIKVVQNILKYPRKKNVFVNNNIGYVISMRANGNIMRAFRLPFVCRHGVRTIFQISQNSLSANEQRQSKEKVSVVMRAFSRFYDSNKRLNMKKNCPTCGLSNRLVSCDVWSHILISIFIQL